MPASSQSWRFDAVPESAAAARQEIRDFANRHRIDASTFASIAICVSEAVTNVIVHAYRHGERPGPVHMRAEVVEQRLSIVIEDDGHGLAPRVDSPGLGLGLPLVAQLSDFSDIRSSSHGGTEVRMRFELGREGAAPTRRVGLEHE